MPRVQTGSHSLRVHARHGFTLVELLVVIGIIALMIGILLPALNKARESAKQVQCLSNMRQLASAIIQFSNEHDGWVPGQAGGSLTRFDPSRPKRPLSGVPASLDMLADWISWQRKIDPITGATLNTGDLTTASGVQYQNITNSSIARYLGVKPIITTTPQDANAANTTLESLFRCPSDNVQQRNNVNAGDPKPYRYSYSMNQMFVIPVRETNGTTSNGKAYGTFGDPPKAERDGFTFNGKITSIKRQSEHIMLIEEDEQTIDDGVAALNPMNWVNNGSVNAVAARHELKIKKAKAGSNGVSGTENARGNVAMWDGHAEFMSRKDALRQERTGRADPTPTTGF
jgi:prepilin-type N-terminal cleavage/methylation domain-containing protein/prepilin-type processing-associated H-X9-DG protein